jgi:hypothetical protein
MHLLSSMHPFTLTVLSVVIVALAVFLLSVLYPLERNRATETVFAFIERGGGKRDFIPVERRTQGRPKYYLPVPELKVKPRTREEKFEYVEALVAAQRGKRTT